MKNLVLLTVLTLLATASVAQIKNADLVIIRGYFKKEKADLIWQKLDLNDSQGNAFWPLYDAYESKRQDLSNQRVAIINDYLTGYPSISDRDASTLAIRTFSNDQSFTTLERDYFKKFAKVIGAKNTAKFYQLENYLREIVRLRVQYEIPFISELVDFNQ